MHEVAIVDALIQQVSDEVHRAGASGRVTRLEIWIGRLSGVHPEAIRFAMNLMAPGTVLEAAELDIRQPNAICRCAACGAQTEIDEVRLDCPRCASHQVTIEGGRELILHSIELDEPSP